MPKRDRAEAARELLSRLPFLERRARRERARRLQEAEHDLKFALVQARISREMTQLNVADLLGISQNAVSKFESYDNDPKLSTIIRYSNAIGAEVAFRVQLSEEVETNLDGHGPVLPQDADGYTWTVESSPGYLEQIHVVATRQPRGTAMCLPQPTWTTRSERRTTVEYNVLSEHDFVVSA